MLSVDTETFESFPILSAKADLLIHQFLPAKPKFSRGAGLQNHSTRDQIVIEKRSLFYGSNPADLITREKVPHFLVINGPRKILTLPDVKRGTSSGNKHFKSLSDLA